MTLEFFFIASAINHKLFIYISKDYVKFITICKEKVVEFYKNNKKLSKLRKFGNHVNSRFDFLEDYYSKRYINNCTYM